MALLNKNIILTGNFPGNCRQKPMDKTKPASPTNGIALTSTAKYPETADRGIMSDGLLRRRTGWNQDPIISHGIKNQSLQYHGINKFLNKTGHSGKKKRFIIIFYPQAGFLKTVFLFLITVFLVSCTAGSPGGTGTTNCHDVNIIEIAKRVTLIRSQGYSQLRVLDPWQGADGVVQEWYLVPRGSVPPEGADSSKIISVPLKKIVCMSTTHLAMINALGERNSVCGFSGTRYIYDPSLRELVKNGKISEIGYDDNIDKEKIISLSPDLVMIYGIGSESAGYLAKLQNLGIRIVFNADYLEDDPLGKAEWIKVIGALYCRDAMADSIFSELRDRYLGLKAVIDAGIKLRKKVLLGMPFKDTWFISPGNSYISALIRDAGGEYLWDDKNSRVSMPMALEAVYSRAVNADFWLNAGNVNSRAEITAIDARLGNLPCFLEGNIYNNNNRLSQEGGNDYWESGCISPDLILKDIGAILHPELFREHKLFYYRLVK